MSSMELDIPKADQKILVEQFERFLQLHGKSPKNFQFLNERQWPSEYTQKRVCETVLTLSADFLATTNGLVEFKKDYFKKKPVKNEELKLPNNVIEKENNFYFETIKGNGTKEDPYYKEHLKGQKYVIEAKDIFEFEVVVVMNEHDMDGHIKMFEWYIYEVNSGYLLNTKHSIEEVYDTFKLWNNASPVTLEETIKNWIREVNEKENYWLIKQKPNLVQTI